VKCFWPVCLGCLTPSWADLSVRAEREEYRGRLLHRQINAKLGDDKYQNSTNIDSSPYHKSNKIRRRASLPWCIWYPQNKSSPAKPISKAPNSYTPVSTNPAPSKRKRDWIYEYMATIIWMSYLMNHKTEKRHKRPHPCHQPLPGVSGFPASLPQQ
jgi:hypothetical protein